MHSAASYQNLGDEVLFEFVFLAVTNRVVQQRCPIASLHGSFKFKFRKLFFSRQNMLYKFNNKRLSHKHILTDLNFASVVLFHISF